MVAGGENKFYISFAMLCVTFIFMSLIIGNKTGELCKNNLRIHQEVLLEGVNQSMTTTQPPIVITSSSLNKSAKRKILYAILATTQADRHQITKQSLGVIYRDKLKWQNKYQVDCLLIYPASEKDATADYISLGFSQCEKIVLTGARYTVKLQTLLPSLLKGANYDYLTLLMDDIRMVEPEGKFDLEHYYDLLYHYNLAAATPGVENTGFVYMGKATPRQGIAGRVVEYIEVQHATYRTDAWSCYWELLDPRTPHGWESAWFHPYCIKNGKIKNALQAVIQTMYVKHVPFVTPPVPGLDPMKLFTQQIEIFKAERGIVLETNNIIPPTDNSELKDI